jgi:hypothetical protein
MKLKVLAFVAFVTMCSSSLANAEYPYLMNVHLLRTDCELPDRPSQIRCEAFLVGVVDTVNAITFWEELDGNYFCTPEKITDVRLRKVFVGYIAAQGGLDLLKPAASLVIRAFADAFPCE